MKPSAPPSEFGDHTTQILEAPSKDSYNKQRGPDCNYVPLGCRTSPRIDDASLHKSNHRKCVRMDAAVHSLESNPAGHFWIRFGTSLDHTGTSLDHLWIFFGSSLDHVWIIFGSFWIFLDLIGSSSILALLIPELSGAAQMHPGDSVALFAAFRNDTINSKGTQHNTSV